MKFCKKLRFGNFGPICQKVALAALGLLVVSTLNKIAAQEQSKDEDALFIQRIFDESLTEKQAHAWLGELCLGIGHRLAGSEGDRKAVAWGLEKMRSMGLDSVFAQTCQVPVWRRGAKETAVVLPTFSRESMPLKCLALGGSVGTGPSGVSGEVVEVQNFEELEKLGAEAVRGKIVFFDRPFDPTQLNTFRAYGGAVDQRGQGAMRAGRLGAAAVLVRSMASGLDDWPHTGGTYYDEKSPKIPAIAISTNDAERLSKLLKTEKNVSVFFKTDCEIVAEEAESANVIGQIRGSDRADEIILVGGHLDSWDVGQGAHDDGAGCAQSLDALRILKKLGYRPRRTLRVVLFANEENGLRGGQKYAEEAARKKEKTLAAIETDAGGFTPKGFGFDAEKAVFPAFFEKMKRHEGLFLPYGIQFNKGGGGADIGPLKPQNALLIGLQPDSHRYFDVHHTENDRFENVHPRELAAGAASLAALLFLIDKYGLE